MQPLALRLDPGTPLALARLHRDLPVAGRVVVRFRGTVPLPVADLIHGGGFEEAGPADGGQIRTLCRARTLPDFAAPDLRVLVCGLNPSVVAADAGFCYAGPTNRFWPAALDAGLVTVARDPWHAVEHDRVGMTDLVKRATPSAAGLTAAEYGAGAARVERLVRWLRPRVVVFVGLTGWRAAVDRHALAGWQPAGLGGADAYVMPSTSGLNAHATRATLAAHLRAALDGRPGHGAGPRRPAAETPPRLA